MPIVPGREVQHDFPDQDDPQTGDVGNVLISDVGPMLARERVLPTRPFRFGFGVHATVRNPAVRTRHRGTVARRS